MVLAWRLVYSAAVLGILGAHEMGHYLACRRYDVDATLPFFLPFPSLSGTLGAVIKIREAFPTRRALFDIAIAGPIAGFVVLVPLLFSGMHLSNVIPVPPDMDGYSLGEPLLFKLADVAARSATSPTATRSTSIRSCSPRGSACWRRRGTCCRSASSTAAT